MGKKVPDKDDLIKQGEELIEKLEAHYAKAVEIKKTAREILNSGWENGAPILPERRKEIERILIAMDILVGDDDLPSEDDQIH
jgi:hypothetical protein